MFSLRTILKALELRKNKNIWRINHKVQLICDFICMHTSHNWRYIFIHIQDDNKEQKGRKNTCVTDLDDTSTLCSLDANIGTVTSWGGVV